MNDMMGVLFWSIPHEAKNCVWSEIWYLASSCDIHTFIAGRREWGQKADRYLSMLDAPTVIGTRRRLMVMRACGR